MITPFVKSGSVEVTAVKSGVNIYLKITNNANSPIWIFGNMFTSQILAVGQTFDTYFSDSRCSVICMTQENNGVSLYLPIAIVGGIMGSSARVYVRHMQENNGGWTWITFSFLPSTTERSFNCSLISFATNSYSLRGIVENTGNITPTTSVDTNLMLATLTPATSYQINGKDVSMTYVADNTKLYVDNSSTLPSFFPAGSSHTITAQGSSPPEITIDYTNTQEPIITPT